MPRKGYKPQLDRTAGMPEKITAQNFNRRISPAEVQILHAAGFGSKTDGFRNLLGLYQELHNMGYRCDTPIREFLITRKKINIISTSFVQHESIQEHEFSFLKS
jgi:hypothetical protein